MHRQIYEPNESCEYSFERGDPNKGNNLRLRVAWEQRFPVNYFRGVAPALYHALMPTYIAGWNKARRKFSLEFGLPYQPMSSPRQSANVRRYTLQTVKQRLHQAAFRELAIAAYGVAVRCPTGGATSPFCSNSRKSLNFLLRILLFRQLLAETFESRSIESNSFVKRT